MEKYFLIITSILIIFFYFLSKKNKFGKAGLTFTVFLVYIIYIVIRILTIPVQYGIISSILGIALFLAEMLGFVAFITYIYIFYDHKEVKVIPIENDEKDLPKVDVLICTYNEPIDLLLLTIIGAMDLDYPKELLNIYVCDDGHRDELRKLTENLNIHYITREKNEFAKAGNINNALKYIDGDLFLVLDADMVPKREYLQKTVGQFKDPKLAFVQAPQTYYNEDVYQYNTLYKFFNEQDFFMRCIEPARNSKGAVLHIGTNALFRKEYVDAVGGYPTISITEDMALGLQLQANGYTSTYINEPLAVGLSALNLEDLVKQRDRWCRGNLQVLKHFRKVIRKKLKFGHKLIYMDGVLYWFTGITKMIFLTIPIIHLLTGILAVDLGNLYLIPIFFESFIAQILLSKRVLEKELPKGYLKFFYSGNIYNTVMAPHLTYSVFKHYFFPDVKFAVTNKKIVQNKGHFSFKYTWCYFVLLILSIGSIWIGTLKVIIANFPIPSLLINTFWILYSVPGLITAIEIGYQNPRPRSSDRITFDGKTGMWVLLDSEEIIVKIKDASIGGVKLEFPKEIISKLLEKDKIQIKIGKTIIDMIIHSIRENNEVVLVFPEDLDIRKKIMVYKMISRFLKPYQDNYNFSEEN